MLRMVTYGDNSGGRGMNSLLNSTASPGPRCVSKKIALLNGTSTVKMDEFELRNSSQSFPKNRLIPVWPIEQSQSSTMCTQPFDSKNIRVGLRPGSSSIPEVNGKYFNRDSYVAGYHYTFEIPEDASWLHIYRDSNMEQDVSSNPMFQYYMDEGAYYYADKLPDGITRRGTYVTVYSEINHAVYDTLNEDRRCDTVCPVSRVFVYLELESTGDNVAQYTGIDQLQLGFSGTPDTTDTYVNIAAAPTSTALSGTYYANNTSYGMAPPSDFNGVITVNRNMVTVNIKKLKEGGNTGGHTTFDIYATWEGVGVSSNLIPVPKRSSTSSVIIIPNNDVVMQKYISGLKSYGNMNITGQGDIDSTSNMVDKMKARCGKIAIVKYEYATDTVYITRADDSEKIGIGAEFYPSTLDGVSGKFVWMGSGASVNRTFLAISTTNKQLTVGMVSRNNGSDTQYQVFMHPNTAAGSYVINGTTVTSPNDKVIVTGNSFTIDLSDSSKYADKSTHRFYIQQIVPVSTAVVSSGNASPEYADIQFTINQ